MIHRLKTTQRAFDERPWGARVMLTTLRRRQVRIRLPFKLACAMLLCVVAFAAAARAQDAASEGAPPAVEDAETMGTRVALAQPSVAYALDGSAALSGDLLTQALAGAPDAPVRNTRIVIRNVSPHFYTYVTGWATFYGADGVRCGAGLYGLEAVAAGERVEVDTPGLRLTCTPTAWRIVATTLLTRGGDVAKPRAPRTPVADATPSAAGATAQVEERMPPLEINVNGKTIPIQPGHPLEVIVGAERIRIVVRPAP